MSSRETLAALLLALSTALFYAPPGIAERAQRAVRIADPVAVVAIEDVAAEWASFAIPPLEGLTEVYFVGTPPPAARVRLDVLVRRSGEWWVHASGILDAAHPTVALPRDERLALLARFEGVAVYGWAEVDRLRERAPIQLMRNIQVLRPAGANGSDDESAVLFAQDAFPLRYENGVVRGAPLLGGLLCAGSSCARVGADDTELAIPVAGPARVIRVDSEGTDVRVLAPGTTPSRPREIAAEVLPYGEWSAVTLPPDDLWTSVVVDVVSDGAMARVLGSELLSLPEFTDVYTAKEEGLIIRPLVGPEKVPHGASEARLLVFGSSATDGVEIPLASATFDETGVFVLPELGSGRYRFKLISGEATGEIIAADVMSGLPVDVVFARGPRVHGRVLRQSGGTANDNVIIEVARQTPVGEDMSLVGDWIRRGVAAADGEFRITLTTLGPYRLRATWGTAYREVDFVLKDLKKDVSVGTITLNPGATVSGTLLGCGAGELRLIPLPNLEQPTKIGFFDLRKVSIAADGAFAVNGVAQGEWLLDATCDGVQTDVQPSLLRVPETGSVFIDLTPVRPKIDK